MSLHEVYFKDTIINYIYFRNSDNLISLHNSGITSTTTTTSPTTTTTTTVSLTSFSSTGNNATSSFACEDKCVYTYYHDGIGLCPDIGDTVYTDSGGSTPLKNGYYGCCEGETSWYYVGEKSGHVEQVGSCVQTTTTTTTTVSLTSFSSTSTPNKTSDGTCSSTCSVTYYHNGIGVCPESGNSVYLDSSGNNILPTGYYKCCGSGGIGDTTSSWYYVSEGQISLTGTCLTTTTTTTSVPRYEINCIISTLCDCVGTETIVYSNNYSTIEQCYMNNDPIWYSSTGYVSPQSGCYIDTVSASDLFHYWDGHIGEWGEGGGSCTGIYTGYLSSKPYFDSSNSCNANPSNIYYHNGTNDYPEIGDTCYQDSGGTITLNSVNGISVQYYYSFIDNGIKYWIFLNGSGVVIEKSGCSVQVLKSFTSSDYNSTQFEACIDKFSETYYHNGPMLLPSLNSVVYTDSSGTNLLSKGFYLAPDRWYNIETYGVVSSLGSCTTNYISYLSSKPYSDNSNVCLSSISETYYHNGTNDYPEIGNVCYEDPDGLTGLNSNYYSFIDNGIRYWIYINGASTVSSKSTCSVITTTTTTISLNEYLIINGGGPNTTDWINPTNGLASNWVDDSSSTFSIVTGNGFTTNAQRSYNPSTSPNIYSFSNLGITDAMQHRYRVSFKYRSNCQFRIVGKYNNNQMAFSFFETNVPINTGDAIYYERTQTSPNSSSNILDEIGFGYIGWTNPGWIEIDEVRFYRVD